MYSSVTCITSTACPANQAVVCAASKIASIALMTLILAETSARCAETPLADSSAARLTATRFAASKMPSTSVHNVSLADDTAATACAAPADVMDRAHGGQRCGFEGARTSDASCCRTRAATKRASDVAAAAGKGPASGTVGSNAATAAAASAVAALSADAGSTST